MGEIAAEVEELGEFDGEVLYWDGGLWVVVFFFVVGVALDIIVHLGALGRGFSCGFGPEGEDLRLVEAEIFVVGVLCAAFAYHGICDAVGVEMCEILMDKGGSGDVGALLSVASCSVDGVDVAFLFELDVGVALMGVLFCEKLGDWVLVLLGFHCYFVLLLWVYGVVVWLVSYYIMFCVLVFI